MKTHSDIAKNEPYITDATFFVEILDRICFRAQKVQSLHIRPLELQDRIYFRAPAPLANRTLGVTGPHLFQGATVPAELANQTLGITGQYSFQGATGPAELAY